MGMVPKLVPVGWPANIHDVRPGLICWAQANTVEAPIWFKSEYHQDDGRVMAFNAAGEFLSYDEDAMYLALDAVWEEE